MIAGIVCEFNPLHLGHQHLLEQVRKAGADTIVCAMSGNFVQRGEPALIRKHLRAAAAVDCGADLVLEVPTPWAMATAEIFARGGVSLLQMAGCDHIAFGSERGDTALLQQVAESFSASEYDWLLRRFLDGGITFAAARQQAVGQMLGDAAASVLSQPNDTLAVEYLRAARELGAAMQPMAVQRVGAMHDGEAEGGIASGSYVRRLVWEGKLQRGCQFLPTVMADALRWEVQQGTAADVGYARRAILAHLRKCGPDDLAPYDGGGEGLYRRLHDACRQGRDLEEILFLAKTKRYTAARLRRMVMASWLGLVRETETPPYARVLAANEKGRQLLRQMQDRGVPVLTKAADAAALGGAAARLMEQEGRYTDLYGLCREKVSPCGEEYRTSPVMK